MKQALIDVIGSYEVNLNADGIAQIDWSWILSALLLILFIISMIKFLGGLLRVK